MRTLTWILLGITLLATQSCTIFSLHPLYLEGDLINEPQLEGIWKQSDDEAFITFDRSKDNTYLFRYIEEQNDGQGKVWYDTLSFEAGLGMIGSHYFLDLYPAYETFDEGYYLFRNFIPAHSFLKIEWKGDRMQVYMFDYDRMKELFEQNRIRIKHEMMDDFIIITAATEDLKKFFEKYADDQKSFDDPGEFIKRK